MKNTWRKRERRKRLYRSAMTEALKTAPTYEAAQAAARELVKSKTRKKGTRRHGPDQD